MLLGLLLPDPCDEHCPETFKSKARALLPKVVGNVGNQDLELRQALLKFIGNFLANWDAVRNEVFLEVGRELVKAAHGEEAPLVVDTFAGGGSIPLEALRLGCETFASDLNPVACLILKVMLEDIPQQCPSWPRSFGTSERRSKRSPKRSSGSFILWIQTVQGLLLISGRVRFAVRLPTVAPRFHSCDPSGFARNLPGDGHCGTQLNGPKGQPPVVKFEIFEPQSEREVPKGTVSRANATCPCCNVVLPAPRVRAQLAEQRGGANVVFGDNGNPVGGARLLVVVTLKDNASGRRYRLPIPADFTAVYAAQQAVSKLPSGAVPDEPTPAGGGSGAGRAFSVQKYGMMTFGDLFTARQMLSMTKLQSALQNLDQSQNLHREFSGLALSRFFDISNALCQWESSKTQVRHLFTRQALPMLWDFAEPGLFGDQAGDFTVTLGTMIDVIRNLPAVNSRPAIQLADARESGLPDEAATCVHRPTILRCRPLRRSF